MGFRDIDLSHFVNEGYIKRWTDIALGKIHYEDRIESFKQLLEGLPIKTILEVGCNIGHNLTAISMAGDYELTGIDISEYAIISSKCPKNIKLIVSDCHHIPFPDDSFDLVIACGYLDWFVYDDLPELVAELLRTTKKYLLVIDYGEMIRRVPDNLGLELLICKNGFPLFWIRGYTPLFAGHKIIRSEPNLSEKFSDIPMSAWIFEK